MRKYIKEIINERTQEWCWKRVGRGEDEGERGGGGGTVLGDVSVMEGERCWEKMLEEIKYRIPKLTSIGEERRLDRRKKIHGNKEEGRGGEGRQGTN